MTGTDFTLSVIASWIANKIDVYFKNKPQYIEESGIENKIKVIVENHKTEVEKLSERFQKVVSLMNKNRGEYSKFTIPKLSEILNDDFTDITHYYPIADSYENMHGKSFIDAQNIVKYQIKKYAK